MTNVSVVIPAYNAARTLAEALESALRQTMPALEIVVIDDGSSDASAKIADSFGAPVRCIRQRNAGVSAARNAGVTECRGQYIAFLDADDVWKPARLQRHVEVLDANPDHGLSFSAFNRVDEKTCLIAHTPAVAYPDFTEALLLRSNVVGTPSGVTVRRDLLERVGGFDSRFSQCADWDLWLRLSLETGFVVIDEALVDYRVWSENMSNNVPLLERDTFAVLDNFFDQPRSAPYGRLRRAAYSNHWMILSGSYLHAGRIPDCLRSAFHGVQLQPSNITKLLAATVRMIQRALTTSA